MHLKLDRDIAYTSTHNVWDTFCKSTWRWCQFLWLLRLI